MQYVRVRHLRLRDASVQDIRVRGESTQKESKALIACSESLLEPMEIPDTT